MSRAARLSTASRGSSAPRSRRMGASSPPAAATARSGCATCRPRNPTAPRSDPMRSTDRIVRAFLLALPAMLASGVAQAQQFKVAIWYDRANAMATFQHQVYDLRKGEYREDQVRRWAEETR